MAFLKITNVAIRGISGCVPKNIEKNKDLPFYTPNEVDHVIEEIGIVQKHVAPAEITVADLCYAAAQKLIEELGLNKPIFASMNHFGLFGEFQQDKSWEK